MIWYNTPFKEASKYYSWVKLRVMIDNNGFYSWDKANITLTEMCVRIIW